jgi:F-type H+-transporting ATPase subunit b
MLINWFTVGAQLINFLLLVWLLKRFLYRPILDAMEARQRRVRECIEAAERENADAGRENAEWQRKNAAFEQEKIALIAQARQSAGDEKMRLVESARAEAETLRVKWHEGLANERALFHRELARQAQEEVLGIARRALHDLAGAGLEERIAQVFVERIESLSDDERRRLAASSADGLAVVRSSMPLPLATRAQIEAAASAVLGVKPPMHFETSDALVAGIELSLSGYKVAWTLRDYLAAIEKSAGEFIDEKPPAAREHAG